MTSLVLQSVDYIYDNSEIGVSNISFRAEAGSILAIVGASGSGKSTLLKLIAGFLKPSSGLIKFGDKVLASRNEQMAPKDRSVGLVFQNHALLPHMTVRKNIEFGCKNAEEKAQVESIMRELRIERLAAKYPHEISGGESQRVSLARAMAANSRIFLMDEPFSSIDSVFRRDLRNDMLRFLRRKDRTTVIVTHDAEEALELADHIVVIDDGHILQQGNPRDIYFHPKHLQVAQLFGEVNHVQGAHFIEALTGNAQEEIFIRPESLSLEADHGIEGRIIHIAYRGNHSMVSVVVENQRCLKIKTAKDIYEVGAHVNICSGSAL